MDFMIVADKSYAIPSDLGDLAGRFSLQSLSYPAEMVPPFASNSLKHCRQDTDAMILPFKIPRTESLALDLLDSRPRNRIHGLSLPMVKYGRGAFTAEQWVELHRQVLIFKCITEGLSLPPALFLAFKSTICNLPGGSPYNSMRSQIVTDPEPGRCRRTDGKKWRCAREVVAHQKYCERHINRGRNRTRKIANNQASAAVQPLSNPTPPHHPFSNNPNHEASIAPIVGKSNTSPAMKNFLPSFTSLPAGLPTGAIGHKDLRFMSGGNLGFSPNLCNKNQSLQLLHNIPNLSLPCQMSSFAGPLNNHPNRLLVSTDICRDSDVQPHRSFLDDWPPSKNSAPLSWQCLEDDKHRSISSTHLSISTPAQFDCMLSSNGGSQGGKESPCCLKLFEESEGMGLDMGQQQKQQHSWVDISWEESVGGPLAEVLHSSSGKGGSGLDVLGDGWDASLEGSSSGGGSPRGVLKKHGFGSYSSDISSSSSSATSPATSFKLHPTSLG